MELSKGIKAIDLALYIEKEKLLAITDLQLGYEGMLNAQGVMVPRFNLEKIKERLEEKIFPQAGKIETILINGDLKHEFGTISEQEGAEVREIIEFLKQRCKEIILVKGNHDAILEPIVRTKGLRLLEEYFIPAQKILFTHGHKIPESENFRKAKTVIIGHEHPCITVSDGVKHETYKCFLKGKFRGKGLIVMPSMNETALGSDISREEILTPLISNADNFEVFAVEDKVYRMGKVKDIIE